MTMKISPFLGGFAGVFIVVVVSFIARFTFVDGSLFDPAVAPGFGPLALGDLLVVAAFVTGYLWVRIRGYA